MGRGYRSRAEDSTFAINLAPMLDIIVSVIPMLLMSVVFVQVNVIETPLPQMVSQAIENQKNDPKAAVIDLKMSKKGGYHFVVTENGRSSDFTVAMKGEKFDWDGLKVQALNQKKHFPNIFSVNLKPEGGVSLDEIVGTMDQLRQTANNEKVAFRDTKTGNMVETNLMFPDVVLANLMGD
jgi:biopolymer transport protein ExbD